MRYNEEENRTEVYDEILKYNISAIYSICIDDSGNPWMGTDNGLFKYDKSVESFIVLISGMEYKGLYLIRKLV